MKLLELDKFVRSIGLNHASPHAFFLGAGASISSGMPSAASCIWEWKRSIFATNNPGLENQVGEVSLPAVRTRIDTWLNANGYAPPDAADEYGFFIDQCIPIDEDRRRFFQAWIQKARPHTGYRLLCLLAEAEIARSVWTTNFDQLTARAASDYDLTVVEVGIESAERSFRQPNRGELVHVALHGDYRYDRLMNTSDELREQDSQLRSSLIEQLKHQSLVVLGYSGRDASVMEALQTVITHGDATGRLYWCGYGDEPADEVKDLLEKAASAGREAYFVPGAAFDDVMARLSLHCLKEARLEKARGIIGSVGNDELLKKPFSVAKTPPTGLIKSNAWPVSLPGEMFQFELKEWPTEAVWKTISNRPNRNDVVAVPFRQCVLALGRLDDIRDTFGGDIKGEILRVPVTERDLRYEDGATISMFRRALVHSIAGKHGLLSDARGRIWEPQSYKTEREAGQTLTIHECASLALRRIDNEFYVVIDPTVQVCGDPEPSVDTVKTIRNRILGYQHNKQFNDALNTWRKRFLQKGKPTEFDFPINSASFKFAIESSPIFATTTGGRKPLAIPDKLKPLIRHVGVEVPETKLLFGAHNGRHTTDTLPLRGLSANGPFDLQVSDRLHTELRLGVICPRAESPMLESFLSSIEQNQVPPKGAKEDYMVEYPGFNRAYGIRFVLSKRDSQAWYYTPEPDQNKSQSEGALSLSRSIRDGVESLKAAGVNQVLIFTPTRWQQWRGFKTDKESFDLHDFVKAYCVQRGIATQFLDQDTLGYTDKCRLWWWLSMAIYTKAMRTPWVLDGLMPDTAYVGIGYAIDEQAKKGRRIVLGCSHLYNAQGQGLQFRLSQIEDPILRGKNPFLRFDDARRMGENIRQLFWDAHLKLPRRIVIHKLTPFRREEKNGLKAGLEGVEELDLVEVNYEPSLRYINSYPVGNTFKEDNFPVRRGTTVKLSSFEALLWIHGATDAVKTNYTYYQGKRRIPAPAVVRRHAGSSDLATLSSEILGLSKMDWNSGDLYSKLPATVVSSKKIAKIGSLLDRFSGVTYDYRLFM